MPDPRTVGSGNPGATNILRQGRKTAAAGTLLGDIVKGSCAPVVIARLFTGDPTILALVAAAAFLGHLYPLFFKFKGGKGVATALGVFLALSPWMSLALVGTWLATALVFQIRVAGRDTNRCDFTAVCLVFSAGHRLSGIDHIHRFDAGVASPG